MHTHRIKVLDRANNDDVAYVISQQLEFVFLPPENTLFNKYFVNRRSMKSAVKRFVEIFRTANKPTACSAECERRANYQREPNFLGNFLPLKERSRGRTFASTYTKFLHLEPEFLAVFRRFNGLDVYTDDANTIVLPYARFVTFYTQVQCRLATHGRKYRVDVMLFENFSDRLLRKGLEINVVGNHLVGHDCRRIGIDQDDLDTLLSQRACSLR